MTDSEKIALVKSLAGPLEIPEDWTDDAISSFLQVAGSKIVNRAFPYDHTKAEVPAQYEVLQCEIALYLLNKRGAEGETSHSENGISRGYENADVPESMMRLVTPYCGVVG